MHSIIGRSKCCQISPQDSRYTWLVIINLSEKRMDPSFAIIIGLDFFFTVN